MNIKTIRNWLNLIFMLGAIVGLCFYFFSSHETGIYIILCAMVVKFCEAALRMMPLNEK
jgi:hypothetical protein